jgi:hypothetical protein
MSAYGPLRHFAATQQFGRFRSEADIQRAALTEPDRDLGELAGSSEWKGRHGPFAFSGRKIYIGATAASGGLFRPGRAGLARVQRAFRR